MRHGLYTGQQPETKSGYRPASEYKTLQVVVVTFFITYTVFQICRNLTL